MSSLHTRIRNAAPAAHRRVGDEIFAGTDYPRTFDGFVGQAQAKDQLEVSILSARWRQARLDHILLASGLHGIGKTTLAQIIANTCGTGLVSISGPITVDEARPILAGMADNDFLFWDEFHLAVAGSKTRADWLLPYLTDHVLLSKSGAEVMPDVTVIAATTDVGKLPATIISRFMLKPHLTEYTDEEGVELALNLAQRMKVDVTRLSDLASIARAANNNPREMRVILTAVRDLHAAYGHVDLGRALEFAGVTPDGLTRLAGDMLLVLLTSPGNTASIESIGATLGEPGPLRHHEQILLRRGFITITGRGRVLTDAGLARAKALAADIRETP